MLLMTKKHLKHMDIIDTLSKFVEQICINILKPIFNDPVYI